MMVVMTQGDMAYRVTVDLSRIVLSLVDDPDVAISSQEGHLSTDERVTDLESLVSWSVLGVGECLQARNHLGWLLVRLRSWMLLLTIHASSCSCV